MRRRDGIEYTEFQELILQRFDTKKEPYEHRSEEERWNIDILINGPEQYGIEGEMLEYAKGTSKATVEDLIGQFDKLVDGKEPPNLGDDDE